MQWTSVLLSEALLAHDVFVCLERPSGALPPDDSSYTLLVQEVNQFLSDVSDLMGMHSNLLVLRTGGRPNFGVDPIPTFLRFLPYAMWWGAVEFCH